MPIPIEKLLSLKHIVVHKKCPDGTAAALILKRCLGYDKPVEFIQYDTEAHLTLAVQPDTVFADFSPHPERVSDFVKAETVVLDHHKTAQPVVAEFGELGVYGDETLDPGIAGATLAYREVYLPLMRHKGVAEVDLENEPAVRAMKELATLAGIRDTWQTQDPRWREACEQAAALDFWPWEELGGILTKEAWEAKMGVGPIVFQKKLDAAKRFGDNALRFTSERGTKVAVFQGVKMSSDVAEYLDDQVDLIIGFDVFLVDDKPAMVFSTRSHTTFNCGKFAKAHGGGGHTKAAGFKHLLQPQDPQPFELARIVLERYETGEL
jgi:oligoribonuclease NrnB/cAMP/cGMP phosphodiesterase (DHH superfamily)